MEEKQSRIERKEEKTKEGDVGGAGNGDPKEAESILGWQIRRSPPLEVARCLFDL